jgi:DNA-binding transcriptional MocR family regulator
VCVGGHHALTVALLAAQLRGQAIVVDQFTYPGLISLAELLNVQLLPCKGDESGLLPDVLREVCKRESVRGVYLMPTIHNPLGTVMPLSRRAEIVAVAREQNLLLFEDDAYGFLDRAAPPCFAHLAPERSFYIYSLSKVLLPGVKTAFLVAPADRVEIATTAVRVTSSGGVPLFTSLLRRWMSDGTVAHWIEAKRAEASIRQNIARRLLSGFDVAGHPASFHLWLDLPAPITAELVRQALQVRGVDIVPGAAFSVAPVQSQFIRLSLGGEMYHQRLEQGLSIVADQVLVHQRSTRESSSIQNMRLT